MENSTMRQNINAAKPAEQAQAKQTPSPKHKPTKEEIEQRFRRRFIGEPGEWVFVNNKEKK
jgi:hypothetical protein